MFGFTHPQSRGAVTLASADPAVPPRIDPRYLSEARDRDHYLAALDWAQALGGSGAFADWRAEEVLPGAGSATRDERLRFLADAAYTHHHPVGTCRMGSDAAAVTDAHLKLRGADFLYVIDASVFPSITTGPVNAAIIALAERASDLLRGRAPLASAVPELR
jgi:choline dehydrogenase-like flavoprotein